VEYAFHILKVFLHEGFALHLPVHNKSQCRELASAETHYFAIEKLEVAALVKHGLKPRKSCATAQVDNLSDFNRIAQQFVWGCQGADGSGAVFVGQRTEVSPQNLQVGVCPQTDFNDFVGDVFALPVAIQPEHQEIRVRSFPDKLSLEGGFLRVDCFE